ncbi:nucleoside hydrolase [Sphingomonas koreensis]|nr:nucleoside hydrolase [Sphingomonas koreensis]
MWGDIDDVLALAGLHALQDRGEAKILAITTSTSDKWCASYINLLDTFYGHSDIPVGLVRGGVTPPARWAGDGSPMADSAPMYTEYVSTLRKPNGTFLFPHALVDGSKAVDSVALLRKTLAAQKDGSVVMIGVGFSTNFARLIESKPDQFSSLSGLELVKRKVRLLSVMAGRFADQQYRDETVSKDRPEYNIRKDIPSARIVFRDWPTPIVVSGSEIGFTMRIKGADIGALFNYVDKHPVVVTYRYMDQTYRTKATSPDELHDHKTFDLTSVLYAIRPNGGYFSLSPAGRISLQPNGVSTFEESAQGNIRYLTVNDLQRARTLEAMTLLASQPPRKYPQKTIRK